MRWVVIFDDDQGAESIRTEHAAAHFDYLAAHRDTILRLRKSYRLLVWGKAPCYGTVSL